MRDRRECTSSVHGVGVILSIDPVQVHSWSRRRRERMQDPRKARSILIHDAPQFVAIPFLIEISERYLVREVADCDSGGFTNGVRRVA